MIRCSRLCVFGFAVAMGSSLFAESPKPPQPPPPPRATPTVADFAYGQESEGQKLDFWQAKSDQPTPVVLFIHGGGWKRGDKTECRDDTIQPLLDAGISVASTNYRFIAQATEQKIDPPVKGCLYDCARALQTVRSKAKEWNLDPQRVGTTGVSCGACTSIWLALHNDLADPQSADPIARESSRPTCVGGYIAQTSLDPVELREWIPNAIYGGHAFGFAGPANNDRAKEFELLIADREKVLPWIKEYSPIEHASSGDPPIYLDYPKQKTPPVVGQPEPDPTHSAIYGIKLAEKLHSLGVECIVSYPGKPDEKYGSVEKFLIKKLKAE
jgi:acetyl esterase/lipase